MSRRGAVYVATGPRYLEEALRSAASLKEHMPGLPVTLFSDQKVRNALFQNVIPIPDARGSSRDKIAYLPLSPYEHTLYLDTDTHVCGDLSDLFPLLARFDIAAAHSPNRRVDGSDEVPESFSEFQAGVILFRKSPAVGDFLRRWLEVYEENSRGAVSRVYDQPSFRRLLFLSSLRVATLAPEYNCRVGSRGYVCDEVKVLHGRRYHDLAALAREINATRGRRLFMISGKNVRVVPKDREVVFMVTRRRNGIK